MPGHATQPGREASFLPIPAPHQHPCWGKVRGSRDHCPLALQPLNGRTCIPPAVILTTVLPSGVIKTFIPTTVFLLLLLAQQPVWWDDFLGWLIFHPHPPGHAPKAAGQQEQVYCKRFELAASSLPSGDPWGKCPPSLAASTSSRSCCHASCRLFLEHHRWLTEIPPSPHTLRLCSSPAGSTAGARNSPEEGWENPIAADSTESSASPTGTLPELSNYRPK